ncbi:MAG: hypothetical protein OXF94_11820 [Gammaproteobacteria bacterium]|nr:hypothetical protein [Gammaproteobacteria bacterium]
MTERKKHWNKHIPEMTERQLIVLAANVGSELMPDERDRKRLKELYAFAWYHNHSDESVFEYARQVLREILQRS